MDGQINLTQWLTGFMIEPGETFHDDSRVGKQLTWSELISTKIGLVVLFQRSTQSMTYYEAVIPEKHLAKAIKYYVLQSDGEYAERLCDRVICNHGKQQRLLIDEWTRPVFYEVA